jgi:hypothetical protein
LSVGVQGIGTGNPGYAATLEKNYRTPDGYVFNAFGGIGLRSNEAHGHPVAGAKVSFPSATTVGVQWDGHHVHPFATQGLPGGFVVGAYLIEGKSLGVMLGARF